MTKDLPLEPNRVIEKFLRYTGLRPECLYRKEHKNKRIVDDPRFREPKEDNR